MLHVHKYCAVFLPLLLFINRHHLASRLYKGGSMLNKICVLALILSAQLMLKTANADNLSQYIELTEWKVPWAGRPRDPYVDASGTVWFCGQAGNYLASLDPATGDFKQFQVPAGSHPHNLIVDSQGFVWYAGNRNGHIGKLDPASGEIKRFSLPKEIEDPHTLVFDRQGDIWFTAQQSNMVGKLAVKSGEVTSIKVPTANARPYGIKIDGHNRPWIVLLGSNKLATVDPQTMQISEISLPREDARPRRLEVTADNDIWYVDYAEGYLGQYRPTSTAFNEWRMPGGSQSLPYGSALDAQHRIWVAETAEIPNSLVGFDTQKQQFLGTTSVPSGGSIRHMYFDEPSNAFWYGVDTGFIGRAALKPANLAED